MDINFVSCRKRIGGYCCNPEENATPQWFVAKMHSEKVLHLMYIPTVVIYTGLSGERNNLLGFVVGNGHVKKGTRASSNDNVSFTFEFKISIICY